jgi:Domain of unknown function (DUF4148)
MKRLLIAVSLVAASASVSAFAQSSQPATTVAQAQSSDAGQWTPPFGQPAQQKTRAQVYQELVHAEKDGQIAYLDSTVYAGS